MSEPTAEKPVRITKTGHVDARKYNGKSKQCMTAAKERIEARTKEAVNLRLLGYSYSDIAEKFGVDKATIFNDVKREMEKARKETAEDVEQIRQQELERIDKILPAVMSNAKSGDTKSIDAMVKLMDRRSKYLGLDAAQKQDNSGIVTVYLRESQNKEL